MKQTQLLIKNGFLSIPTTQNEKQNNNENLMTIINNMAFFGFIPSSQTFEQMEKLTTDELISFYNSLKNDLEEITKTNRSMESFVVYKNFPKEVLDQSESEYWYNQLLIYFGYPIELLTQNPEQREPLNEFQSLKVLHLSDEHTLKNIYLKLCSSVNRWNDEQESQANFLFHSLSNKQIDLDSFNFKENGFNLISKNYQNLNLNNRHVSQ